LVGVGRTLIWYEEEEETSEYFGTSKTVKEE
jgi:hypothetical protein